MLGGEPNDASEFLPAERSLESLREAAAGCRGCHLWRRATQTVFGEGLERARLMFVGEQPGDREDRDGRPFVGPAGRELDKALEAVGIARDDVYITNVVKHFKFEERGKRRIHQTPKRFEIDACGPWFEAELEALEPEALEPEALVALGATAAKALFGSSLSHSTGSGTPAGLGARAVRHGHHPSLRDSARAGRRGAPSGAAAVHRGPADGRGGD